MGLKIALASLAEEQGFSLFGVAPAVPAPNGVAYLRWLDAGCEAEMAWMRRTPEKRLDVRQVLPGIRSVIVLGLSYWQGTNLPGIAERRGRIARYAWGKDYHEIVLEKLKPLEKLLESAGGTQKVYVDTGPVLERDYGSLAGLGWQGKSSMLVSRSCGTWFFLSEILTTVELEPSVPEKFHCGKCERCIAACPSGAIVSPGVVDSRKCLSYWTIEHKGSIPLDIRPLLENWIYGCDLCQEACPWNRFATASREEKFRPKDAVFLRLRDYLRLDDRGFREAFRDSPILRIKRSRFFRNVCVALGNTGNEKDLDALELVASETDPLIKEHASWAIARIRERCGLMEVRCY